MPKKHYPQHLLPPSERYPNWKNQAGSELVYLGWGQRNFERESIPLHRNPGWAYWVLLEGSVEVCFENDTKHYTAGEGMLCGPDCPFGFPGNQGEVLQVLVWIWQGSPFDDTALATNLHRSIQFSSDHLRLLKNLHEQTRIETLEDDGQQAYALRNIRGLIDVLYQRGYQHSNAPINQDRIRTARHWMLNNLSKKNPASALARHMNISTMTLHRIFIKELGEAPGVHFQALKMEHCRSLLAHGRYSVKRVAYEMGYRHAQDFSRAYKAHFGVSPSQQF